MVEYHNGSFWALYRHDREAARNLYSFLKFFLGCKLGARDEVCKG